MTGGGGGGRTGEGGVRSSSNAIKFLLAELKDKGKGGEMRVHVCVLEERTTVQRDRKPVTYTVGLLFDS